MQYYKITILIIVIVFGFLYLAQEEYIINNLWNYTSSRESGTSFRHTYSYNASTGSISIEELVQGPLEQDDPRILSYILSKENKDRQFLVPPSTQPYNLVSPGKNPSMGQAQVVLEALGNMEEGFFVECGALDGETRSNTLEMEMKYGWKGLLIEADPLNFDLVLRKNRKAWASNTCLATKPYPHQVMFKQAFNVGKISEDSVKGNKRRRRKDKQVLVQCFPIFTLLKALDVSVVDYFSLDVEGLEFQVLQTIPFDKILIRALSVEYIHDTEGSDEIVNFMKTKGYRVISRVTNSNNLANDLIFVHESVEYFGTIPSIRT